MGSTAAIVTSTPRFIKLDAADQTLPESAAEWVAVHDTQTGLIWSATSIKVSSWDAAMKKATAFAQGGHVWRAPTRNELFSLTDVERRDPAIDTAFFPDTKSDWYWSSSPVVGWPEGAWGVGFSYGLVYNYHRDYSGFVRPVRVAAARQYSVLGSHAPTADAAPSEAMTGDGREQKLAENLRATIREASNALSIAQRALQAADAMS